MNSPDTQLNVLSIDSSGRKSDSVSRMLTKDLIGALEDSVAGVSAKHRDLADGIGLVDEAWINANFTPEEERTETHRERLAESDHLVGELQQADVLVIGAPIYNFGIPASLKAWVDMIARARLTFRYTENGPEGLLKNKKAILIVASGGVPVDSPVDFATPYLRQALAFIGITNVEVIAADELNKRGEDSIDAARARIAEIIHLGTNRAA
ncbi:MAG: NAD(P)H-dependent oxidoreductase [Pseudomonadota bacterium]